MSESYKPDHCFLVIRRLEIPEFGPSDVPSRIIKTPDGFYFMYDDEPYDLKRQQELALRYGGEAKARRIHSVDGVAYTEMRDIDLKTAVRNLAVIDGCIKLLRSAGHSDLDVTGRLLADFRNRLTLTCQQYMQAAELRQLADSIMERFRAFEED